MKQLMTILLIMAFAPSAYAQSEPGEGPGEYCEQNLGAPGCGGAINPPPPTACPGYAGYHPAVTHPLGFVILPAGATYGCNDFILFGDENGAVVLPPLKPFDRETLQAWADDAFDGGPMTNTHWHYAASWLNRYQEQRFYGLQ